MLARVSVLALAVCALLSGCGDKNLAGRIVEPPEFLPEGQTKCHVRASQQKPLVVEWPAADRAELEARAKTQLVVVRYDGCEMEVLSHCRAPGGYRYTSVTPKEDTVAIQSLDELYAHVPIGAAKLEGKLESAGQLTVAMTMVGRLEAEQPEVSADQLEGRCSGATHLLSGMSVGAFEFYAGAEAEVGVEVGFNGAGAGGRSVSQRETLTRDGTPDACGSATEAGPPEDCGALLRVETVRLGAPQVRTVTCPEDSAWNGEACVATKIITEAVCPAGASWDGEACVRQSVASQPASPERVASPKIFDGLIGDAQPGEGWFCFLGEVEGKRFGQCDRDKIECGVLMGQRISAGLKTDQQRCESQADAVCFQARRDVQEGMRTFCFPRQALCADAHASVVKRGDVESVTACGIYR